MTTTTEAFSTVAGQARQATEQSMEIFKQGARTLSEGAAAMTQLPQIDFTSFDLTQPMESYFSFLLKSVEVNREVTLKWVSAVQSMTGVVHEQAGSLQNVVRRQVETVSTIAADQAERAEQNARELTRKAKAAERAEAKRAHELAREPYEDLTKAELTELLVDRELPKTGTVEELIERLVEADSQ